VSHEDNKRFLKNTAPSHFLSLYMINLGKHKSHIVTHLFP